MQTGILMHVIHGRASGVYSNRCYCDVSMEPHVARRRSVLLIMHLKIISM